MIPPSSVHPFFQGGDRDKDGALHKTIAQPYSSLHAVAHKVSVRLVAITQVIKRKKKGTYEGYCYSQTQISELRSGMVRQDGVKSSIFLNCPAV